MSGSMRLQQGAQTRAANLIVEGLPDIDGSIRALATAVQSHGGGLRGSAAAGLAQALGGWFEAAQMLPSVLSDYAANLAGVDQDVALMDATNVETLVSAPGGGSGLNME